MLRVCLSHSFNNVLLNSRLPFALPSVHFKKAHFSNHKRHIRIVRSRKPSSNIVDGEIVYTEFESEKPSDWGEEKIDYLSEEDFDKNIFQIPSGPGSKIQEIIALALGALLLTSFLNISWRLLIVLASIAVSGIQYSIISILLLLFCIYLTEGFSDQ